MIDGPHITGSSPESRFIISTTFNASARCFSSLTPFRNFPTLALVGLVLSSAFATILRF